MIESKKMTDIQKWIETNELVHFESVVNFNWKEIHKVHFETEEKERDFLESGGFRAFFKGEEDDEEEDDEEPESDFQPDSGSSYDSADDEESDVSQSEVEESNEENMMSGSGDEDGEEWDALHEQALTSDKNFEASDDEFDGSRKNRGNKRAAGASVAPNAKRSKTDEKKAPPPSRVPHAKTAPPKSSSKSLSSSKSSSATTSSKLPSSGGQAKLPFAPKRN
jgi:hypothetical protein